ncbi:MAG: Nramp family divalent metal transporter [Alicyclobacillaceae bacterium]|nr:Nramp family divalent metal transporter [Alicyclobacillaceae bacterium]
MDTTLSDQTAQRSVWRRERSQPSLPEVHGTIPVPRTGSFFRRLLAFLGPGYLVAVGYMDPGNWATDIAGGSAYHYTLLPVIAISSVMAMILQSMAARLGIATGRDLAQACRDHFSKPVAIGLWVLAELAIAACDLAEVIGAAIALNLLFHIPLTMGVLLTAFDVLLVLLLQNRGFRYVEAIVIALVAVVTGSFVMELFLARPNVSEVLAGFIPSSQIVRDPSALYLALGILGATVMPHNLYLHSSIVQTRKGAQTLPHKRLDIKLATVDSTVALFLAMFVNAAILILSAATFHTNGHTDVAEIQDAYHLLSPLLGTGTASFLFAVALLASGQNSTLTGTLAGQVVMEGFLHIRLKPWLRRLMTRMIAIVPAVIVTALTGEKGTADLLLLSQVILSFQLSFAVIPLVRFTSDKKKMGELVNPPWLRVTGWGIAVVIAALNAYLLVRTVI